MGRISEQAYSQKRYIFGQQVHEKMLNITHHQRNANKNQNGVSPHTSKNGCYKEEYVGVDVQKREPKQTVGGNVN